MWFDTELLTKLIKGLVQCLVHAWRSTDPDLLNFACVRHQVFFDKGLIPDLSTEAIPALADSHSELKVGLSKFSIDFLEGLTNVQSDSRIHTEHRYVEQEDKVILELGHALRDLLGFNIVLVVGTHQEVRNKVKEYEYSSTRAEGHMYATFLNTQALAHGSLDVENIKLLLALEKVAIATNDIRLV